MEALEEATKRYEEALTPEAAKYLHERGITERASRTFRLGVVSDPLPGHGKYTGTLAIPYLDAQGRPLTIRFRCIQNHDHKALFHGKYMSMTDDPVRVFNIQSIHQADDVIHVTEGEFDALTLNMIGLPAVAIPGAAMWRNHHRRMLAGFSRVWVWGDPDDAGAQFTQKVTRSLKQAKGVRLPGMDVNDLYKAGGADALLALIKEAK